VVAAPGGLTVSAGTPALGFAAHEEPGRHRALAANRPVAAGRGARSRRIVRALAAGGGVCLVGGAAMLGPGPAPDAVPIDAPAASTASRDPFAPAPVVDGVIAGLLAGEAPEPEPDPAGAGAPPVELTLPARNVSAPVVAVTTAPEGALVLPEPPSTVGWWSPSALPGGAGGTTVLAGHVDSLAGGLGALAVLRRVAAGEEIVLRGADGRAVGYRVSARHQYAKAELPPEVFAAGGPPRLVLITCGGAFDRRTRHYADNVVVFADPV
jgi:hypothetical protein